jgi:hypothetical protein
MDIEYAKPDEQEMNCENGSSNQHNFHQGHQPFFQGANMFGNQSMQQPTGALFSMPVQNFAQPPQQKQFGFFQSMNNGPQPPTSLFNQPAPSFNNQPEQLQDAKPQLTQTDFLSDDDDEYKPEDEGEEEGEEESGEEEDMAELVPEDGCKVS